MNKIWMTILKFGLIQMLKSKKACLALLILAVATIALLSGKLDGTSFAVVAGVIGSIYNFMQAASDVSGYKSGSSNSENKIEGEGNGRPSA